MAKQNVANLAFRFILIIGIVNFFADVTYEGARSVVGPFLGSLGASAAVVGFVAGKSFRPSGLAEQKPKPPNQIKPQYHVLADHPWKRKPWKRTLLYGRNPDISTLR